MEGPEKKQSARKAAALAWGFSGTALVLSLLSVWFDLTGLILGLTLIALIWYTRFTYESVQLTRALEEERRDRRRKAMASALLSEITILEEALKPARTVTPAQLHRLRYPQILEESLRQPELFGSPAVEQLLAFATEMRALQHWTGDLIRTAGDIHQPDALEKIRAALTAVPLVRAALAQELGTSSAI